MCSPITYVRFIVDMSNVPVGYTVKNTVGGNTTKTTKYGGGFTLEADKKINGKDNNLKDGQFRFQLLDENGKVLQTKTNDSEGNITFDRISYTIGDVGKTFTYHVKETAGNDDHYQYDSSVYSVTVTPKLEKDSNGNPTGKILADPTIKKDNTITKDIVFNNTTSTGSLKLTKTSKGHDTPDDAEFTITGPDSYSKTVKYSELKDGSITLSGLPVGTYTVKESKADVDGYTLTVNGKETAEITKGDTAEVTLTNTYKPNNTPTTPTDKTGKTKVPETGDESNLSTWLVLFVGAVVVLAAILVRHKKKAARKRQ